MSQHTDLADQFPGEDAWHLFAEAVRPYLDDAPNKRRLIEATKDEGIAAAVYYAAGEFALEWLEKELFVLEGCSALACLATERGTRRLKTALMSMP